MSDPTQTTDTCGGPDKKNGSGCLLKKAALLTVLFGAVPAFSQTREWNILSFEDGKCHPAKAMHLPNPEALHKELRREGIIDEIKVKKDDDGNIEFVTIEFDQNGSPETMLWLPSPEKCEIMRKVLKENGKLPDDNDLK